MTTRRLTGCKVEHAALAGRLVGVSAILLALGASLGGCLGGLGLPYPLYPTPHGRLPPEQVSVIAGYVQTVDGKDISSHGDACEVLPGCHIVSTPEQTGGASGAGTTIITTGHRVFALPTKPGYSYIVDLRDPLASGPLSNVQLVAYEQDAKGKMTRTFAPALSQGDIEACKQAALASNR